MKIENDLSFRWLGVQGVEFSCAGRTLLVDPFFTRPPAWRIFSRVTSNEALAAIHAPQADFILVTHAHYDHLMDVPAIARRTQAQVYGSANTCAILALHGIPSDQSCELHPGQRVELGPFEVQALAGLHPPTPLGGLIEGRLRPGLRLPLRLSDYVMDHVMGYSIRAGGLHILFCPAPPAIPADVLFAGAQQESPMYAPLFAAVQPRLFVPLHWDNFFRPVERPLQELVQPGRPGLSGLRRLLARVSPATRMQVPGLFEKFNINHE